MRRTSSPVNTSNLPLKTSSLEVGDYKISEDFMGFDKRFGMISRNMFMVPGQIIAWMESEEDVPTAHPKPHNQCN